MALSCPISKSASSIMTTRQTLRLLSILLILFVMKNGNAVSPDGEVLLGFKTAIVDPEGLLSPWKQEDADPCRWQGVRCDPQTKRVVYLNLASHRLSGFITHDIGKLTHLKLLALNDNSFYGSIPSELGNCTELQFLYLQGNFLGGVIPPELSNLSELEILDISSNSLRGIIPPAFAKLTKLSSFNASTNFLTGRIPSEGSFIKFSRDSFVGNRLLCGKQLDIICKDSVQVPTSISPVPGSEIESSKRRSSRYSTRLVISAVATVGALLLVALMCFWGCFLYKKFGKNDNHDLAMDISGGASIVMFHGDLPYSSNDILKKLEYLNEENIIGSGGFGTVYKLAMDDGNVFALKRIVKTNEYLDRFFERELEILGSIKHRYLVNLRGYCNSPSSKLLIYDFLPGGSLDEALHERTEQLDWDARLNIIMGAAKGLAYMHHDCSPRIIHRDIKSSNILLDGNLEARVSDFGLAKLLEDSNSHITTRVAGTFGYLAPGHLTTKSDVYSFGVVLLELLTGRRSMDKSKPKSEENIVDWAKPFLTSSRRLRYVIDPKLAGHYSVKGAREVASLALRCVSSNPKDRPKMPAVVETLQGLQHLRDMAVNSGAWPAAAGTPALMAGRRVISDKANVDAGRGGVPRRKTIAISATKLK